MRQKRESVLSFACPDDELPTTVRQYREKFKGDQRRSRPSP